MQMPMGVFGAIVLQASAAGHNAHWSVGHSLRSLNGADTFFRAEMMMKVKGTPPGAEQALRAKLQRLKEDKRLPANVDVDALLASKDQLEGLLEGKAGIFDLATQCCGLAHRFTVWRIITAVRRNNWVPCSKVKRLAGRRRRVATQTEEAPGRPLHESLH